MFSGSEPKLTSAKSASSKKPSLTSAKAMIKRVVEKVAKDEKISEMRTIHDKLRNIKLAYGLYNKGAENE